MVTNLFEFLFGKLRQNQDFDNISSVSKFVDFLAERTNSEIEIAALTAAWKTKEIKALELKLISDYLVQKIRVNSEIPEESFKPKNIKIIDCCGTGGDLSGTFNISTVSSIVAGSLGCKIVKHGGRKTTSMTGSIDLLEFLKIPVQTDFRNLKNELIEKNLVFVASPALHQILGRWKLVCRKLEIPGQTGLVGTISNPVDLDCQVLGVAKPELLELLGKTLKLLNRKKALVIHGEPRLDEASISGKTRIHQIKDQSSEEFEFTPEEFGLKRQSIEEIRGGSPETNARILDKILNNRSSRAQLEVILLNAGLIVWTYGLFDSLEDSLAACERALKENKVQEFFYSKIKS